MSLGDYIYFDNNKGIENVYFILKIIKWFSRRFLKAKYKIEKLN